MSAIHEKKFSSLLSMQLISPVNDSSLLSRDRLESLVRLLFSKMNPVYVKTLSSEKLQALCFAKVVHICEKACQKNDFNKIEVLAAHVMGLRSLQGKGVYETVFVNINENEFHNLLESLQKNQDFRSLIEKNHIYVEHKKRLEALQSTVGISVSKLKEKIYFYKRTLSNPVMCIFLIIYRDRSLLPVVNLLSKYRLPLLEALFLKYIFYKIKEWQENIVNSLGKHEKLKKLTKDHSNLELMAYILTFESLNYIVDAKLSLLIRILNEGWKNLVDDANCEIPSHLTDSCQLDHEKPALSHPCKSIIDVVTDGGITLFILEKKKTNRFEQVTWVFKTIRIAGWYFDSTSSDVAERLRGYSSSLPDISYDLHLVMSQDSIASNRDLLERIVLTTQIIFKGSTVKIHVIDARVSPKDRRVEFFVNGSMKLPLPKPANHQLPLSIVPEIVPSSSSELQEITEPEEEVTYSCPSYFDSSKMINEDWWAVTFVGYTRLVVEGVRKGDRFRKIIDLNTNLGFINERNWSLKGGYLYFNYEKIRGLGIRDLGRDEEINIELKSETLMYKSTQVINLFLRAEGRHAGLPPFSLFCRRSIVTQKIELFITKEENLQEIYSENESLFFDLIVKSFSYDVDQLRDDHFNPFTGSYFMDTQWILEKLETMDLTSMPSFFGKAFVNDLRIYFLGDSNPACHELATEGRGDKDAVAFTEEMDKAGKPINRSPYSECRDLLLSVKEGVKRVDLKQTPRQFMTTFVNEEDWKELANHIVLVHAVQPDRFETLFPEEFDWSQVGVAYNCLFAIKKLLTQDGVIGKNLESRSRQFRGTLNFRPHIHWSWNQLVQGHSVANWEDALIAILEPLNAFENPKEGPAALGIAPYDTFTIGSHKLSARSTLVVPDVIEREVRKYLPNFQGKIIGYRLEEGRFPIREEIFKALKQQYPETWHVVDHRSGHKVAGESHHTVAGYSDIRCIEKGNGDRIILIANEGRLEGQIKARAIKNAVQSGKYLGIHNTCVTYWLEDQHGVFSTYLKPFKENPLTIKGKVVFAGYATQESVRQLVVMRALEFRDKMYQFAKETKAAEVGDYIWKEAIYADIMSLIYTRHPDRPISFTPYELHLIISFSERYLEPALRELAIASKSNVPAAEAFRIFQKYTSHLIPAIDLMIRAKQLMENPEKKESSNENNHAELIIDKLLQQQEWSSIPKSPDFENRWPLTPAENTLMTTIKQAFASDILRLKTAIKYVQEKSLSLDKMEVKQRLICLEHMLKMHLKEIYYNNRDLLRYRNTKD